MYGSIGYDVFKDQTKFKLCKEDKKLMSQYEKRVPRFSHVNFKPIEIKEAPDDPVNHPSHYTQGKIEVIDFLIDQDMNFLAANAVKYICRYRYKGNAVQDLMKARFYLNRLIKEEEDKLRAANSDPRNKVFGVEAKEE